MRILLLLEWYGDCKCELYLSVFGGTIGMESFHAFCLNTYVGYVCIDVVFTNNCSNIRPQRKYLNIIIPILFVATTDMLYTVIRYAKKINKK